MIPCRSNSSVSLAACSALGSTNIRKFASDGTTLRPISRKPRVRKRQPARVQFQRLMQELFVGQRPNTGGLRQCAGLKRELHL